MSLKTVVMILKSKEGVHEHFLEYDGKGNLHAYCSREIRMSRNRTVFCGYEQVLKCQVCDEYRRKIRCFWERVEEAEREAERQARETSVEGRTFPHGASD